MNTYQRTLTTLALTTLVYGCLPQNERIDPAGSTDITQLKVSDAFTFRSTRDIQLNVHVASPAFAGEKFRVNVYDDFPTIGSLITAGLTDANQNLRLELRTAAPLQYLYVEKVDPFGASEVLKVPVSEYVSADFKKTTPTLSLRTAASSGLDCSTGTTKVYNNHTGNISLKKGEVVGITGTFKGEINLNGGDNTVRICGTANITALSLNGGDSKVYFLEGSKVTIGTLNLNNKDVSAYNYSDALVFTGGTSWGGTVVNHGKMSVNGDLNLNGNSVFTNNGEITVAKDLNNNSSLTNNNSILVKGSYKANGGSFNLNVCKLLIDNELTLNKDFTNRAYIKAAQKTTLNGGATMSLGNGAMLSTKDVDLNGTFSGPSSGSSVVKATGRSVLNSSASLRGALIFCDENGVETNNAKVASSFFTCSGPYYPTSSCNPEGFGKPAIQDADGDGVADAQDEFPNDPTRAFTGANYPSTSGYATYGFEDLWPAKGDYDFNDLVVNFRVTKELNGANRVVALRYKLMVRAVGASFDNGFGFQLDDVTSAEVASVTGSSLKKGLVNLNSNGTESGQAKAVIIAFDTPEPLIKRTSGSGFNVVKNNPAGTSTELEIVVKFSTPIEQSKVAQSKLNPFIFVNGKREQEVHLCNFAPTGKAGGSLFGTSHDKSNSGIGRYYRTANGLPWALEIPMEFEYPIEKTPITEAYWNFTGWATSGGTKHTDWYLKRSSQCSMEKIF